MASVDQPELVGQPCYKHKTCGHLIKVPKNRIPPMVCPWCKSDTKKEAIQQKQAEAQGVVIFDAKQRVINLKKETFNEVIDAIAEFQQPD